MKQKLFLGALLLGALTLNSCVDDTESASVTAVRQAKVEQLQSIADLNKAQAEAAIITANAAKAAQEAQAEYYKAQAAYQQALADYKAAETEAQKAAAEEAMAKAEYQKAYYANQLQKLAGQLEIDLLKQKTEMLKAQSDYEDAVKKGDEKKKAELTRLFTAYKSALSALSSAQETLARNEIMLAQAKAGLLQPTKMLQAQIDELNRQNNLLAEDNIVKQTYIDTWEQYSKAGAQAAIDKAYQEKIALDAKAKEAEQATLAAKNARAIATNTLQQSPYQKAVSAVLDLESPTVPVKLMSKSVIGEQAYANLPKEARDMYCAVVTTTLEGTTSHEVKTYIPLFSPIASTEEKVTYTLTGLNGAEDDYAAYKPYTVYTSYYDLVPGSIEKFVTAIENSLAQSTKDYEAKKKAYDGKDGAVAQQAAAQKAYDDAVAAKEAVTEAGEALKTANTALEKAKAAAEKPDATAEDKKALIDAEAAQKKAAADKKAADLKAEAAGTPEDMLKKLNDAKAATVKALQALNAAELALSNDNETIATLKANADALNKGVAENTANMKALNEANLAVANAEKDEALAVNAAEVKNAEVIALRQVAGIDSNGADIASQIATYKQQINNNNATIGRNKETIAKYQEQIDNKTVSMEQTIKGLEAAIAGNKAQIEVLEQESDLAKAALDAAMAEDAPAE